MQKQHRLFQNRCCIVVYNIGFDQNRCYEYYTTSVLAESILYGALQYQFFPKSMCTIQHWLCQNRCHLCFFFYLLLYHVGFGENQCL